MEKREVEVLLKRKITDEQFEEALEYAKEKQRYIYEKDHREVVLQEWYLIQLTKECVISLSFSRYCADGCEFWKKKMPRQHRPKRPRHETSSYRITACAYFTME